VFATALLIEIRHYQLRRAGGPTAWQSCMKDSANLWSLGVETVSPSSGLSSPRPARRHNHAIPCHTMRRPLHHLNLIGTGLPIGRRSGCPLLPSFHLADDRMQSVVAIPRGDNIAVVTSPHQSFKTPRPKWANRVSLTLAFCLSRTGGSFCPLRVAPECDPHSLFRFSQLAA
jgi:hypothetical protein